MNCERSQVCPRQSRRTGDHVPIRSPLSLAVRCPGGQDVTAAVEDPPLARIRLWWGVFRAQAAHGAYAVTISNGLCDHTRAMPRPIANIVPACLCDVRYAQLCLRGF